MGVELIQGHALCTHVVMGKGILWCEHTGILYLYPELALGDLQVPVNNVLLSTAFIASVNRAVHLLERPKACAYVWIRDKVIWDHLNKRTIQHGRLIGEQRGVK